jgi:excisionase family DNA binding protein
MDIEDAAAYLGVGVDSVRWLVRTRKLPAGKVGKRLKFKKADVDRYIEDCFGAA